MNIELFEKFLIKAHDKYGDKFDYSKAEYVNNKTPITIICPIHGEFKQRPDNHLSSKHGCYWCGRKLSNDKIADTLDSFVKKAIMVHGDKYDYSQTVINRQDPITIVCKNCGTNFIMTPARHLQGGKCPNCNPTHKVYSQEEYVIFFNEHYHTLELLSKYKGNKEYITVRCKIHDYVFKTKPNWLKKGCGCQKCYDDRRGLSSRKSTEVFIEDAKKIHGDKYDYSEVVYKNNKTHVTIICPKHGKFIQSPYHHLQGQGCSKCACEINGFQKRLKLEEFLARSKEKHGEKYDYSKVIYENVDKNVTIICPVHGEFQQHPYVHMNGGGCPLCSESHLEKNTALLLDKLGIVYERQKRFYWLGLQSLDFYLPNYKVAIECQGGQHFNTVKHFGGDDSLAIIVERDERKYHLCQENGVKIEYVVDDIDEVNLNISKIYKENVHML